MKIVADERIPFVKEHFSTLGELILKPGRDMAFADVKDADILLVRTVTRVDEALLDGSTVKWVGSVTAGADHLDKAWMKSAGITCLNVDGFNAPAVADYIVSVVATLQHLHVLTQNKKKAAVIGVGNVGSLVVERLQLLGFDVIVCDPLRAEKETEFLSTSLHDIADVDVITLHVPMTKDIAHATYHMIDDAFLKRQKPGCVLVNTSRGGVIDEACLEKSGKHLYWCFDVWEHEPAIDKKLLERAIIATPHIAGYSVQSKIRGTEMMYQLICRGLSLKPTAHTQPMPTQELVLAPVNHRWQDVVMGIYNPMVTTAMMRATILPAENSAYYFDEMRHQFRYRYEFAYTTVKGVTLPEGDNAILRALGIVMPAKAGI